MTEPFKKCNLFRASLPIKRSGQRQIKVTVTFQVSKARHEINRWRHTFPPNNAFSNTENSTTKNRPQQAKAQLLVKSWHDFYVRKVLLKQLFNAIGDRDFGYKKHQSRQSKAYISRNYEDRIYHILRRLQQRLHLRRITNSNFTTSSDATQRPKFGTWSQMATCRLA